MMKWCRWITGLIIMALLAACSGKPEVAPNFSESTENTETVLESTETIVPTASPASPTTVPPFCEDPQVMQVVDQFIQGVEAESGQKIGKTITESKGLNIRLEWWNTNVHFTKDEAVKLFEDDTSYDWGIADGSGAPVQGSFMDVVQAKLLDVVAGDYVIRCDTLDFGVASGPSAGLVEWPADIPAQHYIAIYRPAPADQELDWRTWVLGFEYVEGVPYISYLVQYHWEI
ncbi:MAG: hypothetical protein RBT34_13465 [Anaerolineaceae bacterium]|jgi:hypothetical protein|nr:hypothetical protein [Anaerolineaceae bacterium]